MNFLKTPEFSVIPHKKQVIFFNFFSVKMSQSFVQIQVNQLLSPTQSKLFSKILFRFL